MRDEAELERIVAAAAAAAAATSAAAFLSGCSPVDRHLHWSFTSSDKLDRRAETGATRQQRRHGSPTGKGADCHLLGMG